MSKKTKNKIRIRKNLLNVLLKYLSPTNSLIVYISQDLDKLVSSSQKRIYLKYLKRLDRREKSAFINRNFRNIA